jgi:effector-binding domain-containing protein
VPAGPESGNIDQVTLPAKPAITLSGQSSWEDGFKTLFGAFRTLADTMTKAGLKPAGRPLALFTQTDDNGFTFEAMAPVATAPADPAALGPNIKVGTTPAGKAYRFTHRAPYEDIDNTYEAITAYLDSKDIAVKDAFIEEYASDPADASDPSLAINIYVQPK